MAGYEVYAALFSFVGTTAIFGLLAVVLIASLLIVRPWCRLLCPVPAFEDYLRLIKRKAKQAFSRWCGDQPSSTITGEINE